VPFRIFRILHAINDGYPLAVFWLYVGLFFLAFSLIFVFPPGALLLVFASLAGLGVAVVVGGILRGAERVLARSILRRGSCPHCTETDIGSPGVEAWECGNCGAAFSLAGTLRDLGAEGFA
jgi:hypothetical protein